MQPGRVATLQPHLLVRPHLQEIVPITEYPVERSDQEIVELNQQAARKAYSAETLPPLGCLESSSEPAQCVL